MKQEESTLSEIIGNRIAANGNWLPFEEFMRAALHEPGYGYYAAGGGAYGPGVDFVTAPELGPLFARCLANFAAPIVRAGGSILELGGGRGKLAYELSVSLTEKGLKPRRYFLLETSAYLGNEQRRTLASAPGEFTWLKELPQSFTGLVLANEVLDTLPCRVLVKRNDDWIQQGVAMTPLGDLRWADGPPAVLEDQARLATFALPNGYRTEINRQAEALVASLSEMLSQGVLLLIDYGFPAREYYHSQRGEGTLMAHRRHRSSPEILAAPGTRDITAHLDFSALASTANHCGARTLGFSTQAAFLLNCGLTEIMAARAPAQTISTDLRASAEASTLLMPHEMGELFKVLALGKGSQPALPGFDLIRRAL